MQLSLDKKGSITNTSIPYIKETNEEFNEDKSQVYLLGVRKYNEEPYKKFFRKCWPKFDDNVCQLELTTAIFPINPICSMKNNGEVNSLDGFFFYQVTNPFQCRYWQMENARIDFNEHKGFSYVIIGPSEISPKPKKEESKIKQDFILPIGTANEFLMGYISNDWYRDWLIEWGLINFSFGSPAENKPNKGQYIKKLVQDRSNKHIMFLDKVLEIFQNEDLSGYSPIKDKLSDFATKVAEEDKKLPIFSIDTLLGKSNIEDEWGS